MIDIASNGGLTMTFNEDGKPTSIKNSSGENLINQKSTGFNCNNGTKFDKMTDIGKGEYKFETTEGKKDSFSVKIECKHKYITFRYTSLPKGNLSFHLQGGKLKGRALDYMITRVRVSNSFIIVERNESWERSSENPLGAFAIFDKKIEGEEKDDMLLDIWVNEGLPHPKVKGKWNKKAALQWLDAYIEKNSDQSTLYFDPKNLEDHYNIIPFVKLLDARNIYLFPEIWRGEYLLNKRQMHEINPNMYPNGMNDILKLKEEVLLPNKVSLSFHSLSGYVGKMDPEFVVEKVHQGLYVWSKMTLKDDLGPNETSCIVIPEPGKVIPKAGGGVWPTPGSLGRDYNIRSFRIGNDWIKANIRDVGDGTWKLEKIEKGKRKKHGAGETCYGYPVVYNSGYLADPNSKLLEIIAQRYAEMSNKIGLSNSNFDGYMIPGVTGRFGCHKYAQFVYENLDHPTSPRTSMGGAPPSWIECGFSKVNKVVGGGKFGSQPGAGLFMACGSRASSGLEDVDNLMFRQMAGNGRHYSLGGGPTSLLKGVDMSTIRKHGLTYNIVNSIKCYKKASFNMDNTQRNIMASSFIGARNHGFNGNHHVAVSLWRPEGSVIRKWFNLGTDIYTDVWTLGQEHGTICPRLYCTSNENSSLQIPVELQENKSTHIRVIGRVLPVFDAHSSKNIDLMKYLSKDSIKFDKKNPKKCHERGHYLQSVKIKPPINLLNNKAIGLWVTGDSSGATLIIRINSGKGRDYAVPINFEGRKWIEVPNGEQGWRVKNWGWTNQSHKTCNYSKVGEFMIGLGHMPPETNTSVVVEGLTALFEIQKTLNQPKFKLGKQTVQLTAEIPTYHHFILDPCGKFTVYDPLWVVVHREKAHNLSLEPSKTTAFNIESSTSKVWLEVGVQASNQVCPNQDPNPPIFFVGNKGPWTDSSNWESSSIPKPTSDVVIKSFATVFKGKNDFANLIVEWDALLNLADDNFSNKTISVEGKLDHSGNLTMNKTTLRLLGGIGPSVQKIALSNSTVNFEDGATFHNSNMNVQFEGTFNTLSFKFSKSGFTTLKAGKLLYGSPWSTFTIEVEMERYYSETQGNKIVLFSFSSHAKVYKDDFNPVIRFYEKAGKFKPSLSFDVESSSLYVEFL